MITNSMLCPCPEHKPHKGQDHCVCFVPCCNLFRPGLAHNRCVIKLLNDKQNEGLGWKEETVKLPKENGIMGSTTGSLIPRSVPAAVPQPMLVIF